MTSLLPLPSENEITLTQAEVRGITGAAEKKLQAAWLAANGWKHTTDRHGWPVVGRLYANLKLGGVDMVSLVTSTPQEWQPNSSAIGS